MQANSDVGQDVQLNAIAQLAEALNYLSTEHHAITLVTKRKRNSLSLNDLVPILLANLKTHYPKAGAAFHSSQSWLNLIKAPILISVAGLHLLNTHIDLSQLRFECDDTHIKSVYLPKTAIKNIVTNADLRDALSDMRLYIHGLLDKLGELIRIGRVNALGLFADTVLQTLKHLTASEPAFLYVDTKLRPAEDINMVRMGNLWLRELQLTNGHGHPLSYLKQTPVNVLNSLPGNNLTLVTKACCQGNKTEPFLLCQHCPKLVK